MYMFKYVMKRLGLALMTFCIIMLICFVLIKLLPLSIPRQQGVDANLTYFRLVAKGYIKDLVYDGNLVVGYSRVPIMAQLWTYVKNVFRGDFGIGFTMAEYRMQPVWDVFVSKLPPTILINVYSTRIGVPIGLGLGILAALKKNKWQDQVINIVVILLISVPSIVLGLIIQYVFCFKLNWFPIVMKTDAGYFDWEVFKSMLPAVFALCLGSVAGYARYTRAELAEVLTGDYMLLARTKGLTRGQATFRHALRKSMVVIFPSILSEFVAVLSGSLVIERMFSIPGVGQLYLDSITYLDYDFFMMLSGFYCIVGLLAAIIVDISYGFIDPRIRMGAK